MRVWDLHCGSELWVTDGVIASLAFHPVERLLVIAIFNELHFWDWSEPEPTTKVLTCNEKEKVRYVKFDKVRWPNRRLHVLTLPSRWVTNS